MLAMTPTKPALAGWRVQGKDDFGIMLLEMWAYVCDVLAFYDEVIAHECYVRTARRNPSLRKLIGLLGYKPKPAVSASVDLAVLAEGRQPVILPPGTAFRSGAFDGEPPQVFELRRQTIVHPAFNRWSIKPPRRSTFGDVIVNGGSVPSHVLRTSAVGPVVRTPGPMVRPLPIPIPFPGSMLYGEQQAVLLRPENAAIARGDLMLMYRSGADSKNSHHQAATAVNVSKITGKDGCPYVSVEMDRPVRFPAGTPYAQVRLLKPAQKAYLRKAPVFNEGENGNIAITLDGLYPQIRPGSYVIITWDAGFEPYSVTKIMETREPLEPEIGADSVPEIPSAKISLSKIMVAGKPIPSVDFCTMAVHFGFMEGGRLTAEAGTSVSRDDTLELTNIEELPADASSPVRFLLEDKNVLGVQTEGSINYAEAKLDVATGTSWDSALRLPVKAYGNVASATRGETVKDEVLGNGNASQSNQSFKLKKKPLSYVSSTTADNEQGVASTLVIWVNGIRWSEVKSFVRARPEDRVYAVTHTDDNETIVTFGDGRNGSRLPTGTENVKADYQFGAGAASPPAGSINQLAKPVKGLTAVKNPLAAYGGDDAESEKNMRTNAPRSALIIGRAVSLNDFEAVAAGLGGVRAVRVAWHWHETQQCPVVQIWYVGDSGLERRIATALRNVSDPSVLIDVEHAHGMPVEFSIQVVVDTRYSEQDVLSDIRTVLTGKKTGILTPENIGIGTPLYRSRVYEAIIADPRVVAVHDLQWNGALWEEYALSPGTGKYFDIETGALLLNGQEAVNVP